MAVDPSILLQAHGVELPNPLALAGQGLTLGNAAIQNQMGQLQLAKQQALIAGLSDPDVMGAIYGPNGLSSLSPDKIQQYAPAAPELAQMALSIQEKRAQINKDYSQTDLNNADSVIKRMAPLGNMAANIARNPGNDMAWQNFVGTVRMTNGMSQYFNMPNNAEMLADPAQRQNLATQVASAVLDPKQQTDAIATTTKLPYDVASLMANTNSTNVNAGLAPWQTAIKQQAANAESMNAATTRAGYLTGKTETGPGNVPLNVAPAGLNGPLQATTIPNVSAATPGQPAPPATLGPSPVASAQIKSTLEPALAKAQALRMDGERVLQIAPALQKLVTSGYSGPIAASDEGKTVLNQLGQMGLLNPDQAQKLGAMQASTALTSEMLGSIMGQISQRGNQMALKVAQTAKPGAENSIETRLAMLHALISDGGNMIQSGKALNQYVQGNPQDTGLTGYTQPPAQFWSLGPSGRVWPFPNPTAQKNAEATWAGPNGGQQ